MTGRAAVPSGASTGEHEALELRDGDKARYLGKGVLKAVRQRQRAHRTGGDRGSTPSIRSPSTQAMIDPRRHARPRQAGRQRHPRGVAWPRPARRRIELGLPLYRYVGGAQARTLPVPMMNILNGGAHADTRVDVQEFMVLPWGATSFPRGCAGAPRSSTRSRRSSRAKKLATGVGDEGGYAPDLPSNEEALKLIMEAIGAAGFKAGEQIALCLDVAASEFYDKATKKYVFKAEGKVLDSAAHGGVVRGARRASTPSCPSRTAAPRTTGTAGRSSPTTLGKKVQLVGDDLFVTNVERLAQGIEAGVANSILVKVNQIGTLTETFDAVRMAHRAGYTSVMSHRSGETEDTTIADLAVALDCGLIKTGSASRSDRIAKYNQLLRIEEELGAAARYAGRRAIKQ